MRITKILRSQGERQLLPRKASGAPPGSLIYTGRQEVEQVHVHLSEYEFDYFNSQMVADSVPAVDDIENNITWYDVRGLHRVDIIEELGKKYNIHPLAMEDILDVQQRPKLEVYEDGVLMQLKAFLFRPETRDLEVEQVSIYLTKGVVLTFQEDSDDLFAEVRRRLETAGGRIRKRPADYLAYALVDNIADRYFTVLDSVESSLDQLEGTILTEPQPATKRQLHDLRLAMLAMRKNISPLREMVQQFAQSDHHLISEETQLYARDLKDHIIQISDLVETYRDVTNGLYDLYVSEISFRMNSVMQTLTVVSTIFIPLSFLTGVYGMNFVRIPELEYRYGYFVLWGFMSLIIFGMLYWFRRRKWL